LKQKFPLFFISELTQNCNSSTDCVKLHQYRTPWDSSSGSPIVSCL
jgi:hypothetical protein